MKIFLSALEGNGNTWLNNLEDLPFKLKWNLLSYYYVRSKRSEKSAERIRDNSELILIDSGAHSFQKGARVSWEKYTREYADFIKEFDRPNVLGYFEMDVDKIIGYKKVLELRKILLNVTDKIIPVWHKNRGIADFDSMCKEFSGKIVAISGFKNEDIADDQYLMFLKHAKLVDSVSGYCPEHENDKTPKRVVKMLCEVWQGEQYTNDEISALFGKVFESKEKSMVVVSDIPCFSYCEHHLALIYNLKISVGYLPQGKIIGLSKIARIADMVCRRLQLQERICSDIADIMTKIVGDNVIVYAEGEHSCLTARGIKKVGTVTKTLESRGKFEDVDNQSKFFSLLRGR